MASQITERMTVREAVLAFLRDQDMTRIFGNPGSTELPLFRAFPDDFHYVLGLQEAVVVGLADGFAQASGGPAFVNLHSAAGTGHAMGAIFTAWRNRTPLIITAGQQARSLLLHDPFLYSDRPTELVRPYVKYAVEPARAEDVPQAIARAWFHAMTYPRGPVFVSVPADDWDMPADPVPARTVPVAPGASGVALLADALRAARRPALVVGGEVERDGAWEAVIELAERFAIPVWHSPLEGRVGFPQDHGAFRGVLPADPSGVVHKTIDYPGVPIDHATIKENHGILKNVRIPIRPHFGVIGLAPKEADIVDSIPPSYTGGNIDNWRIGKGATMYYPVAVEGALLSVGDPHASQGDSELCGTAIESSLNGTFQIILHKKADLVGTPLEALDYPMLETRDEWLVHGFSFANYLSELGDKAQSDIYSKSSVDLALRDAFRKMRKFLMTTKKLTEDEAISLITVGVDFGITQVVDGNWGVHAVIKKDIFAGGET